MIDLSHLTEEEQVSIMRVLQRDAELRKVEEKRVRHVQESVKNEVQCKNMTGEWFYKAKAKRHKDTLHGAELIKASMWKKKPMTIYERLQSKELKENSKSFMNNIEKSVYVSPELSVFLEEPKLEDPHTSTTLHKNNSAPKPQPTPRQSTPSGKQRENPFNRTFLADDIPNGEKKSLQLVGTESVSVTPLAEKLSQPKENVSRLQTSSNEFLETKKPSLAEDGIYSEGHPVPKPRTISYKLQDSIPSSDQHHSAPGLMNQNGFNGNSTTPKKSILKHSPSSSSNDSEILLVSVQDSKRKIAASPQTIPEGLAEINTVVDNEELLAPNSLERLKQVRFSTNVDEKKISPTLEFYNENKSSKIGEGSLLDTDYSEETIEENADGMDNAREDESPDEANGFSAQSHLSFLSEDPLNMDQDDNVMSNSDFQSIPATSSHIANHTNNHLASSGSGKLTNRVREMDTGEILTENKVNRRLNSASNLANHSVDKQIPHTEFESPQVSNQQPAKIFQGKHVNFVVPLFKTASMEQRREAHSAQSQMPDKYTAEHMKAADESISKVLDWFTRSEEMPSVNERLKEVEPPSEPIVENKLPLNAKPDTEFSHTESDIFTKSLQEMQNVNGEIQRSGEQGIQLKEVQTPTKVNIFHKSVIPEAIVLEEKSKMKTKNGFESTYPISENVIKSSNNQQQHIRLERDESKQGLLVSEKGRVEANVSADGESDSQATSNVNFFLATTNKNDIQVTESRSESTSLNPEESKTLPTSGVSDITEDALNAFQNLSSKHRTSYQENSFANAVFRKSAENEDTIDIKSSNYKSANKASNAVTTASLNSTFFDNGAEKELDRTKIKKQQSVDGNEHVTTTRENPFLEQARQGSNEHIDVPVYDGQSALRKNTTLNKAKTKSSLKQNEEETNVLQDKIHVKAIDLKQTLNNDENSTKVNFQLEKNDTNVIPKNEKPFTIVSIKKKICNTSDDPHQDLSHFTNLRNFWDKGTKTLDDAELGLANTSDDKHSILKIATNTEQKMLLEAKPSITNYPDDLSKNESMKTEECHGPSVQERMQQILQQRESQPDKKRLNTKYFPKVLPTEPEEIKLKLKTANNALNKNELLSTSNDFQKHSSEVGESAQERIICDPKSQESNNLNIGLQWRHQEKDENETSLIEEQHKHERVLLSDNQTFMLSDESADRMINSQSLLEDINQSRPNTYSKIGNNKDDNISEKLLQSQIPNVLKPPEKSFQNENSSIKQISSKEVSSNEENLALFAGRSPLVEENDIPQKNLNNSESLDNMIHGNLKTVEEDKLSSIKGSKYNENLGIDLNKDNRGFDLQDQFQMELNLPSGTTRTSTFKENSDSPTKRSMESFKAGAQDNPDQDASSKNVLLDYSRGSDHLHAETWRSSLSEEEEGSSLALKRNSRTSETYKSLQDIHVISSRMPNTLDSTNQEMLLSADNVSSIPTTPENASLQSKRMKRLSKSVPAFPENDDADSMSEGSFQMDKHGTIASSLTNISGSSGMASRSSVSGSTMSIYSSDIGNIDVRGKIQFSLDYVDKLKEFHIFVVRCSDLAAAEEKKNRSDPYVKSYLLPDKIKTGKRKTTVKKRTLNPVYNEILRYKIDKASLMAQTLNLSVWHNDTFGRNSFLGEVEVELRKWDWSNKKMDWHDLKPRTISANRTGDKGSLKVAFRYIPQGYKGKKTGEVQIWVKEASNLPQIRPSRLDPFVKCFILPDTSRKSRQKTRVVKKSTNPVFNHTMVYDGFSTEDLKDACVELSVWDHDKLINHFLGGLRIGLGTGKSYGLTVDWMDSTEEEISVWDKMMTHPNTWVEDVLPLRMLMLSKMSGT